MFFKNRRGAFLWGVVLWCVLAAGACSRKPQNPNDPKIRLNEYIANSFAIRGPQDKVHLLEFLTGDAKTRLQSWSDDQFREAFVDSKRKFVRLAFDEEKPISDHEVSLTYELTYQQSHKDPQGKVHEAKITNQKLARMIRDNGQWYIAEVKSIKELVEYEDEMSLP